jgi:hypothetical protein
MVERAHGLRFAPEALDRVTRQATLAIQDLDGHAARQPGLMRAVDRTHGARTHARLDAVATRERGADQGIIEARARVPHAGMGGASSRTRRTSPATGPNIARNSKNGAIDSVRVLSGCQSAQRTRACETTTSCTSTEPDAVDRDVAARRDRRFHRAVLARAGGHGSGHRPRRGCGAMRSSRSVERGGARRLSEPHLRRPWPTSAEIGNKARGRYADPAFQADSGGPADGFRHHAALGRQYVRRTGGNPLVVRELVGEVAA